MESLGFVDTVHMLWLNYGPATAALVFGLCYIAALLWARRIWIYRRNTAHLYAYADMVEASLPADAATQGDEQALTRKILDLLEVARKQVPHAGTRLSWRNCFTPEGAGKQLAAWRLVHDADKLATELWSEQRIEAYAVVAKEELKAVGSTSANVLSETIAKTIDSPAHSRLRPLIQEARGMIFDARDNYYEELSDWQNKALWLVLVTTAIVVLLAATQGHSTYLLLGAAGGLLARLSKTMTAKSVGFDYGVSWSVLFLAPLVGALTGWAGVLVASVLVELKLLNPELIKSSCALASDIKMMLAVLFGFSARLFEEVMSGAEAALKKKPASGSGGETK